MQDLNGDIVIYIGQPWSGENNDYKDKLIATRSGRLTIKKPDGTTYEISTHGFSVSNTPYEEYKKNKDEFELYLKNQHKSKQSTLEERKSQVLKMIFYTEGITIAQIARNLNLDNTYIGWIAKQLRIEGILINSRTLRLTEKGKKLI